MGGACSTRGEMKILQNFSRNICREDATWGGGGSTRRRGNNIRMDFKEIGYAGMDWIHLAQVRFLWAR
jgi:hypothetical protein